MRFCVLFASLILSLGCGHFSGPRDYSSRQGGFSSGEFRGPQYNAEGGGSAAPADYLASQKGAARGYRPKHAFVLGWPLQNIKINQPFNPRKRRRPHLGIDLAGSKRTPVVAAHEGLVVYAGRAFRGFGKMVVVEYDNQWASLYAHLDKIDVKQGAVVERGQEIGLMGRTGRATGVHLHFELLHNQRPIDPIPIFRDLTRLVDSKDGDRGHERSL